MNASKTILITGAAGFIGRKLLARLAAAPDKYAVIGTDLREPPGLPAGVRFLTGNLLDQAATTKIVADTRPDVIVHLAAIVVPPPGMSRETMRQIDVDGTRCLLDAALAAGTKQFIVTSSGAAYGYHADNPQWLTEDLPPRGNPEFAYSDHKRLVEEMLADYRAKHPGLSQLVLRPGTVLGADVGNQITAIFAKPRVIGVRGSDSPFVFIWDQDLVDIIVRGIDTGKGGVYNVAGDGAVPLPEVARMLGKPYIAVPPGLLKVLLSLLHPLGLVPWGPEQIMFLQYRPVLLNTKLKSEFGYTPRMTSREAFAALLAAQPALKKAG